MIMIIYKYADEMMVMYVLVQTMQYMSGPLLNIGLQKVYYQVSVIAFAIGCYNQQGYGPLPSLQRHNYYTTVAGWQAYHRVHDYHSINLAISGSGNGHDLIKEHDYLRLASYPLSRSSIHLSQQYDYITAQPMTYIRHQVLIIINKLKWQANGTAAYILNRNRLQPNLGRSLSCIHL